MTNLNTEQERIDRMNLVADELLRKLVQTKDDSTKTSEAELLLAEFMGLMGYQL